MPELQPGDPRRLGTYEIVERLGEGGQGVVYLGRDADGTKVAIKLLRADLTENESARNRFVREVQAAKKVARFCTAQVLEADVAGDRPYIVSEFVPGKSLQKLVTEEGPRTGAALDRLAIGTMTALVAIHQAGIVHRDFKPHNVLMAPDGPRVIDFGIARALESGSAASTKAIGTPAYMAPEQVMGSALTEAVDVFSWGSTMVFAATGRPPFGQDSIPAVINRLLNEEPDLTGVPDDLVELIRECLNKDPKARPTAQALMMRLIGGGGPAAGAPSAPAADATRVDGPGADEATRVIGPGRGPDRTAVMGAIPEGGELPTEVLAEGQQRARQTGPAPARRPAGRAGAGEGTLPGVPGHPQRPGRSRIDDGEGGSKGPLLATVAAVAGVLLLIGGLVYLVGDRDPQDPVAPTQSVTPTVEQQEPQRPSRRQEETQEPAFEEPEPKPKPTGGPPAPPDDGPADTGPPSPPASSPPPGDSDGGDTGGGDTGGGGDPGTGGDTGGGPEGPGRRGAPAP
ncbi:serine/threonine-protein kinase [Thermomonospora catenispora]|uniref:serine/threonine-protein kinase n=1 Tax=Thermomonospora catenispora TaxID=2493090 RepID=UPI00111F8677|nr:serine/threonine-protein kinase [Thermomonospora catenispora]TNY35161.1 serine/threonine protein kinase [Thermomonospora catenispora]